MNICASRPIGLLGIGEDDVVEQHQRFSVLLPLEIERKQQPVPRLTRLVSKVNRLLRGSERISSTFSLVVGHGQRVVGTRCGRFDLRDPGLQRHDRVVVAFEHRLKLTDQIQRAELLDRRKRVFGYTGFEVFEGLFEIFFPGCEGTQHLEDPSAAVGLGALEVDALENFRRAHAIAGRLELDDLGHLLEVALPELVLVHLGKRRTSQANQREREKQRDRYGDPVDPAAGANIHPVHFYQPAYAVSISRVIVAHHEPIHPL